MSAHDANWDAIDWLGRRHSVGPKHLGPPAPTVEQLQRAAALADRAPDHGQLRACRFVRVADAHRDVLATLFEAAARRRGHDDATATAARERAYNGPALVAVVVRLQTGIDDVPEHEQWLSAGAALMNFLNALHLMGYAAKVLSGASVRDPDIRAAFCDHDEQLAAWIVIGSATRAAHARPPRADRPRPLISDWR